MPTILSVRSAPPRTFSLMPTIVVVSGHAVIVGLVLAITHDYLVIRSNRGVLYMPKVDLGITVPDYFVVAVRAKIRSPTALRDALEGVKVRVKEAVKMGIVHSEDDTVEGTMEAAMHLGEELVGRSGWERFKLRSGRVCTKNV